MYELTPDMLQHFEKNLKKFHDIFHKVRCGADKLEELLVLAIKSDTSAQHRVDWQEGSHRDKWDIRVYANGNEYPIQIKSGKVKNPRKSDISILTISSHRLGRFKDDFPAITDYLSAITDYLNSQQANILSVSHKRKNNDAAWRHIYCVRYLDIKHLTGLKATMWKMHGKQYQQILKNGVIAKLHPAMSWQIWWDIPTTLTKEEAEIVILTPEEI